MTTQSDPLKARAEALRLHGLLANWGEFADKPGLLESIVAWEEQERRARSLARRTAEARLPRFKPLADFDWSWPRSCDRGAVTRLMSADFVAAPANVVLVGPGGTGKTAIAANLANQALVGGHTVRFANAAAMLSELAAIDSDSGLRRRLGRYRRPHLLVIDELGYMTFTNRQTDLLFAVVASRYQRAATIVTTNLGFRDWPRVMPGSSCAAALVDRLVHGAEIVAIDGDSWRGRHLDRAEPPDGD